MSLYSFVNRGVAGRLGQRRAEGRTNATDAAARNAAVRLPGASMRVLEASLAIGAIATAILIGLGR